MIEVILIIVGFILGFPCGAAVCIGYYKNKVDKIEKEFKRLKKTDKVNVIV